MAKVIVLLSEGFEEIEAVSVVDILRRAGIKVTMAAVNSQETLIKGVNGITIAADTFLEYTKLGDFDAIVLPGGFKNAQTLASNEDAQNAIKYFYSENKLVAAICAAPIALGIAGAIDGDFTCYPGCEESINIGNHIDKQVVVTDKIITSQGPGTAICFALAIVARLEDEDTAEAIKNGTISHFC